MTEPTKEQIIWFWGKCGFVFMDEKYWVFKPSDGSDGMEIYGSMWITPDGMGVLLDLPPIDLNNLFEYAVPKFREICSSRDDYEGISNCDNDTHIFFRYCERDYNTWKKGWICHIEGFRELHSVEGYETSALALFWAIYKAFGGEV